MLKSKEQQNTDLKQINYRFHRKTGWPTWTYQLLDQKSYEYVLGCPCCIKSVGPTKFFFAFKFELDLIFSYY